MFGIVATIADFIDGQRLNDATAPGAFYIRWNNEEDDDFGSVN